ncbi:MAG: hypothetical protein B7Y62_11165 [Sphingomonadales bacterium 35-56-22]|nr:MAG: hypothetical protein B7Y62_11165 [Sphingomonadales bacterium 35-56-22]OYY96470.1 MAG: hypothetical protein B7Y38_10990 [Sphingomonadales bacterium 28-56-43]OYZ59383.1 MAG: hypothetical protein B7Y10_11245 [Sphingomonadales bacterium 24-56-14]
MSFPKVPPCAFVEPKPALLLSAQIQPSTEALLNAYRVLLTRARQGLIVFVPDGAAKDPTRPPAFYDETSAFLVSCGIPELK